MYQFNGRMVFSATDLTKHLVCPHVTTLDQAVALGERDHPAQGFDEQLHLVFDKGVAHEAEYLAYLQERFSRVVQIGADADRARAEAATVAAMAGGVDVIYQATLFDGSWIGYADFLLRRDDQPSRFGDYCYDIADTKLARRLKVPALLQMATYAERLQSLQGVLPAQLIVVAGDRTEYPWRLFDVAAYARRARDRLHHAVRTRPVTEPAPNAYCSQCRWSPTCTAEWAVADDVHLVAGMRAAHRQALLASGIRTMHALAEAKPDDLGMLSATVRTKLWTQARLQVAEQASGQPSYRLLPAAPGRGLLRLPAPDPGDVYLDFEGDPFAEDGQGREYLAGLWDREGVFIDWWAHDQQAESRLVADLLAHLVARWRAHPNMHVYHYAPYEQAALKRLTGRYGVGEGDLDALLRGERFVDLYAVVRHGLQVSKPSYSIKKLEDFYWGQVRSATAASAAAIDADAETNPEGESDSAPVVEAMASVVEYERYLVTGDQSILEGIRDYNREDVRSTQALHDWLEERRGELVCSPDLPVDHTLERPVGESWEGSADSEAIQAEKDLAERLLAAGEVLFAGLVGWHRREDRPEYWEFFARADMSDDELVDSTATAGRLGAPESVDEVCGRTGRVTSRVYRYAFPPQECALVPGDTVVDVDTRTGAGSVRAVDAVAGWIEIKRGVRHEPVPARAFGPGQPINKQVMRGALVRAAEARLAGIPTSAGALIDRKVPESLIATTVQPKETAAEAVVRVGGALNGHVLAVQGPPGAGKTFSGSALIRALLDSGRTVGVTAQSHTVIRNLLREVGRPALHKVSADSDGGADPDGLITPATSNDAVAQALRDGSARLVGGTAWLWARAELHEALDVLVIDEAGQFSLANAVAVAGSARSLVLLGDPQQLRQPTKADHPYGADVSCLEHLIGSQAVIAADRGLFLDRTWRMHPEVTGFVSDLAYDGRLESAEGRERQRVSAPGRLEGAGLRWIPVEHHGNVADSPQEVTVVAGLVADLLRGRWTDPAGIVHPITTADILVIAPYNAHVRCLQAALPHEVRVGTVDRFQGQQAPVVIYAMGSSSAADAPRGVSFLFDVHRLTVAVSRAKALSVIVGSPALLDAPVNDPEQLRAVNALCEFVERAQLAQWCGSAAPLPPPIREWEQPILV